MSATSHLKTATTRKHDKLEQFFKLIEQERAELQREKSVVQQRFDLRSEASPAQRQTRAGIGEYSDISAVMGGFRAHKT